MEISELTLKLIILLTPGILATTIYKRLTIRHKEQSDFMFVVISIMFGMFSYLILQIFNYLISSINNFCSKSLVKFETIKTFSDLSNGNSIPYSEVILACVISIILGFSISKLDHSKLINTLARKWKISNKYGDENLYSYFLNSPDINWVYVRVIENSITYLGCVESFSETPDNKEIVLGQVTVYTYPDSKKMYEIDRIYLVFPKDKVIIEQANLK
ncbi:hypothetical protein [Myroides odoratus]|uniref:Uncharacterized protein n=1 Tax=Myroides odoratus TaxID=256 RepID=A0A378RMZ2_MYROD|nr:hypothetical protein [Myroides odoratus]QQU04240.1 hypothetical protein I6I89_02850 [Myroides odoratus]STZ28344.1 Uncharacterised protein [Myroides odoratus]